jgi:hypothetical protein
LNPWGNPLGLNYFCCGVNGEFEVTGWKGRRADTSVKAPDTGRIRSEPVFVFPADAGVVDVTRAPYRAKGDGHTDDTRAIQQALDDHPSSDKIIYLPNGTYVISDTSHRAPQIISWFTARWPIETIFQEVRAHLGFKTTRQHVARSVLRTAPCFKTF